MKKIKATIFDLDGTLGNTVPLCVEAFRKSLGPLIGRTISDEEIIATFGPSEEGTIMALVPDNYKKGISDYLHYYEQLHEKVPKPFDGIIDLLNGLKNRQTKIAMVTGKGKYSTKITLQKFGIAHFFEIIETGHPYGPRKTEGIEAVLNYFKDINKNEITYIGDAPNDVIACKKVGIPIVAAAWADTATPEKLEELNPEELFYNISDFTNWIYSRI
jgi:phosphoglycolate phosphatase-like HAD superfamily hydrolase